MGGAGGGENGRDGQGSKKAHGSFETRSWCQCATP
ncbi:hypothetical protein CC_2800 [Caulobacter vibrioides CB15]|uniref:Uncharacterized protein n=1 Tax=Caulobacter vibrioides (strain ATCC 19089 / CIP 103742 / CB 15) TaxID=190650 RepID=Q9A4N0_CAUVC|nr:hypothetical protein CC_2800 [Caulobacter vibrioides CB15]